MSACTLATLARSPTAPGSFHTLCGALAALLSRLAPAKAMMVQPPLRMVPLASLMNCEACGLLACVRVFLSIYHIDLTLVNQYGILIMSDMNDAQMKEKRR